MSDYIEALQYNNLLCCAKCGRPIDRNPYPPYDWYHYEGDNKFDHKASNLKYCNSNEN